MKSSKFHEPMFTVALSADRRDALALIDFVRLLYEQDVAERLLCGPSGQSDV